MSKKIQIAFIIFSFVFFQSISLALENFYEEGKKKYDEKKFDKAKFLFQRSIVFNPKEYKSYLYLAKIYNSEKNKEKEEKNIRTVLLLNPTNEEAVFILMKIELKKSNYLEVKKSLKLFTNICKNLCEKEKSILESLKNLEPENDS